MIAWLHGGVGASLGLRHTFQLGGRNIRNMPKTGGNAQRALCYGKQNDESFQRKLKMWRRKVTFIKDRNERTIFD